MNANIVPFSRVLLLFSAAFPGVTAQDPVPRIPIAVDAGGGLREQIVSELQAVLLRLRAGIDGRVAARDLAILSRRLDGSGGLSEPNDVDAVRAGAAIGVAREQPSSRAVGGHLLHGCPSSDDCRGVAAEGRVGTAVPPWAARGDGWIAITRRDSGLPGDRAAAALDTTALVAVLARLERELQSLRELLLERARQQNPRGAR